MSRAMLRLRYQQQQQQEQQSSSSNDNSNEVWKHLELFLARLSESDIGSADTQQQLQVILSSFKSIFQSCTISPAIQNVVLHLFYPQLKQQFIQQHVDKFWHQLNVQLSEHPDTWTEEVDASQSLKCFELFSIVLDKLYGAMSIYLSLVDCVQKNFTNTESHKNVKQDFLGDVYSKLFSIHILHQIVKLPNDDSSTKHVLPTCIRVMLLKAFDAFCTHLRKQDADEEEEGMEQESSVDHEQILKQFSIICKQLNDMGMSSNIDSKNNNICTSECLNFVHDTIQKKIEEDFAGQFEEESLSVIMSWLEVVIIPFLQLFFSVEADAPVLTSIKSHIQLFIYTNLSRMRINELFDIIKCYPDSKLALIDLKECLIRTGFHNEMIASLRRAISKRLIIPGAKTIQIISQFINIIKAVSIIDPTGVSLKYVGEDIKNYLRDKRSDTVKCLVRELIDQESNSDLYEELLSSDPQNNLDYDSDDTDEWNPSPISADPSSTSKGEKAYPDIIKIFVNIFRGNKDLFINEYRSILSDRLLAKNNYETNDEARILELLKIRFGEKALQTCEIMIKDISDSKFINNNIKKNFASQANIPLEDRLAESIDSVIMSRAFWPPQLNDGTNVASDSESDVKLHPVIVHMLEEYEKQFKALKAPRKLIWNNGLGSISFQIEIGSKQVDVDANPIAASVLLHFCDQSTWTLSEISRQLNIDKEQTEKRVMYWVIRGFLRRGSTDEEFSIVDELDDVNLLDDHLMDQENEFDADNENQNELAVYESIIINMLTNMEVMPLDKIHNMLALFVHDPYPPYDKTMQELGAYLNELVQEGKLEFDGGMYRVNHKAL